MKTKIFLVALLGLGLGLQVLQAADATAQSKKLTAIAESLNAPNQQAMPIMSFKNVTLSVAVQNLARQAGINYIFDPQVHDSFGPSSRFTNEPILNVNLTNVSPALALVAMLDDYSLTIVPNPATTVARITLAGPDAKPVPASQVGDDTNAPVPLIVMQGVPLSEAIKSLSRQAGIDAASDPALSGPPTRPGGAILNKLISVRWEKITARQALAALLDNYGLELLRNPGDASYVIRARSKSN